MKFAPLIRVSTEKQADKGESLNTQKKQITGYVEQLNGNIPEDCWKYSGQEHATVGEERQNLDQLLHDATKDKFDAVIVCDVSRWSRDNLKSKQGLQILRDHGIKFYVGTTEFDLFSPQANLFLGMSTEMNEFFGMEQSRKSLENWIERAKKGYPTAGSSPWGRRKNKKTGKLENIPECQDQIRIIAHRFLNGESAERLAKVYGISCSNLLVILRGRFGNEWVQTFNSDRLNIHKEVPTKIPRLLPDSTIKKIHKQLEANTKWRRREIKHKYLLKSLIFCENCGHAMLGQTISNKYRYYRHSIKKKPQEGCIKNVRANDIEEAIVLTLFNMYGDENYLKRAMEIAIPNPKKVTALRKERKSSTEQAIKIEAEKQNIVKSIAKGIISDDDAKKSIETVRERAKLIDERINEIDLELKNIPTEEQMNEKAERLHNFFSDISQLPEHLNKMSYNELKEMVTSVLGGRDWRGERTGVYVKENESSKEVIFTITGALPDDIFVGTSPLTRDDYEDLLCWPTDRSYDVDEEIKKFKLNMRSRGNKGVSQKDRNIISPSLVTDSLEA